MANSWPFHPLRVYPCTEGKASSASGGFIPHTCVFFIKLDRFPFLLLDIKRALAHETSGQSKMVLGGQVWTHGILILPDHI